MPTITWKNWRGKMERREYNNTIHTDEHIGEPGWAMLLIAANTHLSVSDLLRLLDEHGVGRSRGWIQRRRWMFQKSGTTNRSNRDGNDARATQITTANPTLSVRQLVRVLSKAGITRGREWVRQHRCG